MRLWIACALVMGCESDDRVVVAESNDLGIVTIEIDRTSPIADLVIRGLGSEGQQIATATVRAGEVEYDGSMQPHGREVVLMAGGETYRHSSPDLFGHDTIEPPVPAMVSWLHLSAVASEIDKESGIHFAPSEVAFNTTSGKPCEPLGFPTTAGSATSCCMTVDDVDGKILSSKHVNASGTNVGKIGMRSFGQYVCATSTNTFGCTSNCYYGPCGAHVDGVLGTGSPAAVVFHPNSAINSCGYDTNGATSGGTFSPEANSTQFTYGGMTPSCTCTGCDSSGNPLPLGCNTLPAPYYGYTNFIAYTGPQFGTWNVASGELDLTAPGVYTMDVSTTMSPTVLGVAGGGGGGGGRVDSSTGWGGGGGGGGASNTTGIGVMLDAGTIYLGSVGAGGARGTEYGSPGSAGGATTFSPYDNSTLLYLNGGGGGQQPQAPYDIAPGGAGGAAFAGAGGVTGGAGGYGGQPTGGNGAGGASSATGGGGGGGHNSNAAAGGAGWGESGGAGGGGYWYSEDHNGNPVLEGASSGQSRTAQGGGAATLGGGGGAGGGVWLGGGYRGGGGGGAGGGSQYNGGNGGNGAQGVLVIKSGASPDGTTAPPASQIVDGAGGVWTIGSGNVILLNGGQAANGYGTQILWKTATIYVFGTDSNWWRWTGSTWSFYGPTSP